MAFRIPKHIRYIILSYLTGIMFFTVFRVILFLTEIHHLSDTPAAERFSVYLRAFLMGLRFDTVISGYILILPLIVLSFTAAFKIERAWIYRAVNIYIVFLYICSFMVCAGDISYFNFYYTHLTAIFVTWADNSGFILSMIFKDFRFWWVFIPLTIIVGCYLFINRRIFRKVLIEQPQHIFPRPSRFYWNTIGISVLAFVLMFLGIRGRLESKSPIRIGTAYFCNYTFANLLGLNPVFPFVTSFIDLMKPENETIRLMDNERAVENVRKFLNVPESRNGVSPIAREIRPVEPPVYKNVVLILMESMSTAFVGRYGNRENLTPFLDGLIKKSYIFDNIYTSGIHTCNGVYATLFSYPSIRRQHPLKTVSMKRTSGIGTVLKKHGYSTIFFTTHDDQFDNIGGFLRANDYDRIVSLQDYPVDKKENTWGVPDDFMFDFSIPILNGLGAKRGQPFFAVFMTTSNHRPYSLPGYYKPRTGKIESQMVEYADWALEKFMTEVMKQEWFKDTLFVFVADHGAAINSAYEMPLNLHHTPLIFYSPGFLEENKSFDCYGGQMDIFPTVMGLLRLPYTNNTLGIDLLKEKRPYIFFSEDDKYGVLDGTFYLITREDGGHGLYRYKNGDPKNYSNENKMEVEKMKNYAESMFQTAQWMLVNGKY